MMFCGKMASCSLKTDNCYSCMKDTKYVCLSCGIPVCNICSSVEPNEDARGWLGGRSVGYCTECFEPSQYPSREKATLSTRVIKKSTARFVAVSSFLSICVQVFGWISAFCPENERCFTVWFSSCLLYKIFAMYLCQIICMTQKQARTQGV